MIEVISRISIKVYATHRQNIYGSSLVLRNLACITQDPNFDSLPQKVEIDEEIKYERSLR